MKLSLPQAVSKLKNGEVVALPTETVYGLAAAISHPQAVYKIFDLKGRPADNPLIVHVSGLPQVKKLAVDVPPLLQQVRCFWPGPLTVVLKANLKKVPPVVRAGLKTVAIRWPQHKKFLHIIKKVGPLAAPSANLSGSPSPTRASHIEADYGRDLAVVDGGVCERGVESTVIRLYKKGWKLLRHGALSEEELEQKLGPQIKRRTAKRPQTPGQKYRHYAPKAKLVLCESKAKLKKLSKQKRFEAVLGFTDTTAGIPLVSLGSRKRPSANLKSLYHSLRELDRKGYKAVLVDMDFVSTGLGQTLWERLHKASCAQS